MPLKLLGKKSWNVYNANNIARVRRDEAEARAREAADDVRQKAYESARHSALLRGEEPPPPPSPLRSPTRDQRMLLGEPTFSSAQQQLILPKRKRNGEDDTDFEMRVARVRMEATANESGRASPDEEGRRRHRQQIGGGKGALVDQRSLVGRDGHIDLFRLEAAAAEAAALAATAKGTSTAAAGEDELASVVGMRFVDAVGKKHGFGTWYAGDKKKEVEKAAATKKQTSSTGPWPRHNPQAAVTASANASTSALLPRDDPLAAMKQGAATARAIKRDRKLEAEQRRREIDTQPEDEDREKRNSRGERDTGKDESRGRQRRHHNDRHHHGRRRRHHDHDDHKNAHQHRSDQSHNSHHHHRHKHDGRDSLPDDRKSDK